MSPDGTKFLLLRPSAAGSQNIFVVDLQGNETLITPDALSVWHYVGWSPLGDRIVLRDEGGRLLILDALQAAPPFSLSKGLGLGDISVGSGSNYKSADAFRPPNGDEILFAAHGGKELMAIRPDGTGLRTIVDAPGAGLGLELGEAQWSPDGSQIVFSMRADDESPVWVYLVNADGSDLRALSTAGDHLGPQWSPDGTSVAFQYWTPPPSGRDWVAHPIGIVEVATGELRDVGPVSIDGYLRWEWSPDGSSILEAPRDGVGGVVIVNATTGHTTSTPWSVDQPISWQRLPLE
jgi:Tol biopolymer transport system component